MKVTSWLPSLKCLVIFSFPSCSDVVSIVDSKVYFKYWLTPFLITSDCTCIAASKLLVTSVGGTTLVLNFISVGLIFESSTSFPLRFCLFTYQLMSTWGTQSMKSWAVSICGMNETHLCHRRIICQSKISKNMRRRSIWMKPFVIVTSTCVHIALDKVAWM